MTEAQEFFRRLEDQLHKDLPLVAYRDISLTNGNTRMLLQPKLSWKEKEEKPESGFIFAPFDATKTSYIIGEESAEIRETIYPEPGEEPEWASENQNNFPPELLTDTDQKTHEDLVQKGIDAINKGQFKKVVLSRVENVETQLSAIEIFKKLLHKYEQAFVYLWFHPETGIWLGATPETLLKSEHNKFNTMALAGTQPFKGTTNVSWGAKEIEEQQIVTDSILQSIRSVYSERVVESEPYTVKAGNLLHIRTDITGYFQQKSDGESELLNLKQLINALHPTPAVCGLPKETAKNFILEHELHDREFYSGYLGEFNMKKEIKRSRNKRNQENQAYGAVSRQTCLFVNLRCMKLEEGNANLYIGGGITRDSHPTHEWEETVNKSYTIKSVLVKEG